MQLGNLCGIEPSRPSILVRIDQRIALTRLLEIDPERPVEDKESGHSGTFEMIGRRRFSRRPTRMMSWVSRELL